MKESSEAVSAYRIVASRWVSKALTGEGAREYGGRWNSPGRPLVYLADSRALCALEILVHLTTPESRRKGYQVMELTFPPSFVEELDAPLPLGWDVSPPTQASMDLGDHWLRQGKRPILRVPSAIVPEESLYLLNPLHREARQVQNRGAQLFRFDRRLLVD